MKLKSTLAILLVCLTLCSCGTSALQNVNTLSNGIGDNEIIGSFTTADITVTDDYCTNALSLEVEYLLSFDNDRLLANFRKNGGQDTLGAECYDGWENSLIGGHTMGHYLVALAQASINSGIGASDRAELYDKLTTLIDELALCQRDNGFLWGSTIINVANVEIQFDNVERGKTDLFNESWVPWYTMHKILEGLVYTYEYTGYEPALEIAVKLGNWVCERTSQWDEATHQTVLSIEYGGMNDVMYELYHLTGEDKYAVAAHMFDEDFLFESIRNDTSNILNNQHANTTIPKILGAIKRYEYCHGKKIDGKVVDASDYLETAKVFWQMVIDHHTYITGANSEWERFGEDDVLNQERTNCNCETCNVYNMLKLSRELFSVTGEIKYADYYENAFINDILASQNPETGMTTYFQAMATGYFRVYSTEFNSFWCCTGSGMESFTKLGDSIYFYDNDSVYVNIYLSSILSYDELGLTLTQKTDIPVTDTAEFTLKLNESKDFTLKFRIPDWAKDDPTIAVNGTTVSYESINGYAAVTRTWQSGDTVSVTVPLGFTAYNLADGINTVAFKYGPVLLAAQLGDEAMTTTYTGMGVLIPETSVIESDTLTLNSGISPKDVRTNPGDYFERVSDASLEFVFTATCDGLIYSPYYTLYNQRYGIYWKLAAAE